MSERLTITLSDERYAEVVDMVNSDDYDSVGSKSAAVNQLIDRGEDVEIFEARVEDLRRQLQAANSQNDRVEDLAEYVDEERSLQQRERERRDAPLWDRLRWFVFGRRE